MNCECCGMQLDSVAEEYIKNSKYPLPPHCSSCFAQGRSMPQQSDLTKQPTPIGIRDWDAELKRAGLPDWDYD